jgi:hypothetical protein
MKSGRRRFAAALAVAVTAGLGAGCASHAPTAPRPVPVVPPASGATGLTATGERAITPPNGLITDAQVRSYVLSHPVPRALSATNIAIKSISFLPSSRVSALLHSASLDVPAQEPICLVLMTGTFVFAGPPGGSPTFPVGVEAFDAKTGNLLQAGGLPALPAAG